MTTIHDLFAQLRSLAHSEHQKGVLFERFIMAYLQADPVYAKERSRRSGDTKTGRIDPLTGVTII